MSTLPCLLVLALLTPLLALPGALAHQEENKSRFPLPTSQATALILCEQKAASGPGKEFYDKRARNREWRAVNERWLAAGSALAQQYLAQYESGQAMLNEKLRAADPEYAQCVVAADVLLVKTCTSGAGVKKLHATTTLTIPMAMTLGGLALCGILGVPLYWRVAAYTRSHQQRVLLRRILADIERVQKARNILHHLQKET